MVYTFDDAKAADRRTTQYFEMFGNRAIYHDGWVAATRHSIPWLDGAELPTVRRGPLGALQRRRGLQPGERPRRAESGRSSRSCRTLFAQGGDPEPRLPAGRPPRRSASTRAIAGRPDLMGSRTSLTLYEGMTGITENAFINIKGRSYTITADVEVPRRRRERRDHRAGRPVRRLEPVHEGRPRRTRSTTSAACERTDGVVAAGPRAGPAHDRLRVRLRRRQAGLGRHRAG